MRKGEVRVGDPPRSVIVTPSGVRSLRSAATDGGRVPGGSERGKLRRQGLISEGVADCQLTCDGWEAVRQLQEQQP